MGLVRRHPIIAGVIAVLIAGVALIVYRFTVRHQATSRIRALGGIVQTLQLGPTPVTPTALPGPLRKWLTRGDLSLILNGSQFGDAELRAIHPCRSSRCRLLKRELRMPGWRRCATKPGCGIS